jgi:signal transduction histidine kinase
MLDIAGLRYIAGGVAGLLAVIEVLARDGGSGTRLLTSLLLAVATTAPAGLIARHISAATAIISAAFVSLITEPRLTIAGLVVVALAFYQLGRHQSGWLVAAVLAPFAALAIGHLTSSGGPAGTDEVVSESGPADSENPALDRSLDAAGPEIYPLLVATVFGAAAGLGWFQRTRAAEAEVEAREATVADELAAHSARGERARIARELHDVVAHRISSIAVQAETARLTTPDLSPDGARQLVAIGDNARDALAEMRRLLGVLRKDSDEATHRQPQPGIAQLPQLIAEARELSGATIRLIVSGPMTVLPPAIELTAYRVVQESLTNSRRHAPDAPVDVELEYREAELRVRVRDVGPGSARTGSGLGLLGMRERVEAVGGELTVDSGPAGGFVVAAVLPRRSADHGYGHGAGRQHAPPEAADG